MFLYSVAIIAKLFILFENCNQKAPHARGIMVQRRAPQKVPVPQWHPKWELGVVLSGHLGWVRSISFDPSNQWFATGSMDRTIKIWDFPKSVLGDKDCLKLTLTGHISGVRGLAVSDRHPYLFSGNNHDSLRYFIGACFLICIVSLY